MDESLDINNFYQTIVTYESVYGNDIHCLKAKAKLFYAIGDYDKAVIHLLKVYELDKSDVEVIYNLAVILEKTKDLALSYVYYALAAKEYLRRGMKEDYKDILAIFKDMPLRDKEIFDTIVNSEPKTIVLLSICGYSYQKQRYQNLAVALAQLGNKVIYVNPVLYAEIKRDVTEDELAEYTLKNAREEDGVIILQPIYAKNYYISSYNAIVRKLSRIEKDAVFIISNIKEMESLIPLKGKNTIIFDCADDNSDYKNAFWSSPELYAQECQLLELADYIICTSVTLFLKKYNIESRKNVYLSNNAVAYREMQYDSRKGVPEDLKDIPKPRIGYIGCVYQRFDKDLFYALAKNNPDKSFVIVGDVRDDYIMPIYKNIYILGSKPHNQLSQYYSNMDICLIPYYDNEKMSMSCDPVKIHEQIFCKVPTITTYMPDTALNRPLVYHANTVEGFQMHIDNILRIKPTIDEEEYRRYILENSWINRACGIMRVITNKLYDYEASSVILKRIQENYGTIKEQHQNFGIVYGISMWNDRTIAYRYIKEATIKSPNDFNKEILEKFERTKNNIMSVNKDLCTGCMSCVKKCPTGAITIVEDEVGFKYPKVKETICVDCGLCVKHCHVLNPVLVGQESSYCYAMATNDTRRYRSSSGGFFPVIAEYFQAIGGYVCGVVYNEDFTVKHIVTNDINTIKRMYESKYVESDMIEVYSCIEKLLKEGEKVLFSGCPCQCKALYSYLGKAYGGLYTIAVVCHGVPSNKFYREHLKYLTRFKEEITEISFRKKEVFGWKTGLYIKFNTGREYINSYDDEYIESFLTDISLREACYDCKNKADRYYDLNIGDFWGLDKIINDVDNLGYSYISINSEKGKEMLSNIVVELEILKRLKKQQALKYNPNIRFSAIKPLCKEAFLKNSKDMSFTLAFREAFNENIFDVVLILWYSNNYGNALTNYALYKALSKLNYRALVVDNFMISPCNQFKVFAEQYFELSSRNFPCSLKYLINCSNNFMVGSDQVWNYEFSLAMGDNGYFQLSFIPDNKNKVSYGCSFGESSKAIQVEKKVYYEELYKRFDSISTREKFGVGVLKEIFDVESTYVLDPVFLLDKNDYFELIKTSNIKQTKPFIVTYLLTPTQEKIEYVRCLRNKLGKDLDIIHIIDAEPSRRQQNVSFFTADDIVKTEITVEDYLFYFKNSEYIITDSYHGTCFSIIFEKKFVSFVNRESERFLTFKEWGLDGNILTTIPLEVSEEVLKAMDYTGVNVIIKDMREKSLNYLRKALKY